MQEKEDLNLGTVVQDETQQRANRLGIDRQYLLDLEKKHGAVVASPQNDPMVFDDYGRPQLLYAKPGSP
ncbi:hypothetical protein H6503_01820 [Candidatus Woesearchaeota archaeon]|nr:hypothetical protein [Candidatus Woesearchaeota archaeon]